MEENKINSYKNQRKMITKLTTYNKHLTHFIQQTHLQEQQ